MQKLQQFPTESKIDIFIFAASVDGRGYEAVKYLINEKDATINQIIVFDYKKFRPTDETSDEYKIYYSLIDTPSVRYISCESDGADCSYINQLPISENMFIIIDITCISIPDVFKIFYVLYTFKLIKSFNVVYTEPKYYDYKNGLYFEYEQHMGPRDYIPLNEYFSSAVSKDIVLVCFLGFERLVSKYIHERKEHNDVVAINGFPAYLPKLKDISLEHNYELVSTIGVERVQYAQANDPFSAYNILEKIHKQHEGELLDICVLGSKPMALGACMFALKYPNDIKVSYPFPTTYYSHTALDVADIWIYQVEI